MPLFLQVPTSKADNMGSSIFDLFDVSQTVNQSLESDIIIDFSKTKFQSSCFLGGLFVLIKDWTSHGRNVFFSNSINAKIATYLKTINFEKGYNLSNNNNYVYSYYSKSYTPIFSFPTVGNQREACLETATNIIFEQSKLKDPVCRAVIDFFLSELTNNVADHSEASHGIIFVQTYRAKGFMDITIADPGKGVFNSYDKTVLYDPKTETEAIEMAVNGCSTKDEHIGRGFGLSRSRNLLVDGLNGTFCLWSGENIFIHSRLHSEIVKADIGVRLNGCYVNLRLPLAMELKGSFYDYMG